MNYLLYGTEDYLIKKEINTIKLNNDIEEINYFDLNECNLKDILDDASTISLFSTKRMIIVENSYIFTGTTSKKKQDTIYLEKYLNNSNNNTILIFITDSEKLDSRKKIVNLMKEKGIIKEFIKNYDIKKRVLDMFKGYNINSKDLDLFINRVGNNLSILDKEVEKLKTYKGDDLNISSEDIINVSIKTIDVDIFHFIDNIVSKNKEKALESYYEMIKLGEEPIKIIVILSNQFRLIYQVKKLNKKRVSIFEMMNILGQKKYPIEKALDRSKNYSDEVLLNNIYKLAELDIDIKSGRIDKNIGLELFILEN